MFYDGRRGPSVSRGNAWSWTFTWRHLRHGTRHSALCAPTCLVDPAPSLLSNCQCWLSANDGACLDCFQLFVCAADNNTCGVARSHAILTRVCAWSTIFLLVFGLQRHLNNTASLRLAKPPFFLLQVDGTSLDYHETTLTPALAEPHRHDFADRTKCWLPWSTQLQQRTSTHVLQDDALWVRKATTDLTVTILRPTPNRSHGPSRSQRVARPLHSR